MKMKIELLTKLNFSANRAEIINLLITNNSILETLCSRTSDVAVLVDLLPEAKDTIIEKINTNPSILSQFVKSGGLPNLRPLFKLSQSVLQRNQLLETILTNETLLIQSLK